MAFLSLSLSRQKKQLVDRVTSGWLSYITLPFPLLFPLGRSAGKSLPLQTWQIRKVQREKLNSTRGSQIQVLDEFKTLMKFFNFKIYLIFGIFGEMVAFFLIRPEITLKENILVGKKIYTVMSQSSVSDGFNYIYN